MLTSQSVNVTSLAEPTAAINKSLQQLPPQRSLRARPSLKTLVQRSLPPEQQSNTRGINDDDNEKDNKEMLLEERRGSALVSEIMRRLSRAQPALPSHDIHIHDTSNLSEDIDEIDENNIDNTKGTSPANKKSLSDLPILRIPVPPSILKTSSESVPHKVQGRKIQFIDPILSNSSSEVDSMSNASSSMLEHTPDKRLDANHPTTNTFIVSSDDNNNKNNNPEGSHELYYIESTPLKENEVIVNNIETTKSPSSLLLSSSSESSSLASSPAFGSLESTPHRHNTPDVQSSSLPTLAQVHPLMETNRPRDSKQTSRMSLQQSNKDSTPSVPEEVHRAAPLPARPRMSRERVNKNKSNNSVNKMTEEAKPSLLKEHRENNNNNNNRENELQKARNSGDSDVTKIQNLNRNESNNDSQSADQSKVNSSTNNNSDEDHFSIPPFRHEQHASASNTLQTSEELELTKAELLRQLQKYEEEVRQTAERSLRPSDQDVEQTHPVDISPVDAPLLSTNKVKPAETVKMKENTEATTKIATESKVLNKPTMNKEEVQSNERENKKKKEQEQYSETVEVPLIDTSLTPEIQEEEFPHVPSVNQTNRQHTPKTQNAHKETRIENNVMNNNNNKDESNNDVRTIRNEEQTKAEMQNVLEEADQDANTKQQESANTENLNAYNGDNMESILHLLLYNELSGSKNKHSLQYLMNRWEKRQKRDLAKRMQELLGVVDTHSGQHHTREKSKHKKKHHKFHEHMKEQEQRHHTKEKSDDKNHTDANIHNRYQSHKHKQPSPHKHHHKHHKNEHHKNEEKDLHKDLQEKSSKIEEENNSNSSNENTENNQDYPTTDVMNEYVRDDSKPNDFNDNNNNINVKGTPEMPINVEQHTDYNTLTFEELKAAARRHGLEFAEKTKHWEEESHETLPSFTSRPTSSLYNEYNFYNNNNNNKTGSANNYVQERQTRTALREKYLGRRTLSPSAGIDKYSKTHFTNAQYHVPRNYYNNNIDEPWSQKEDARANYFDDHHNLWSEYAHTHKHVNNNFEFYQSYNKDKNDINIDDKHYFNDYNDSIKTQNNNINNDDDDDDDDEVHSYHSYQDNDNLYQEFNRYSPSSFSSPFRSTRREPISPRQSHYYQPMHRANSITKRRLASPLPPPTLDTNTSEPSSSSTYFDRNNNRSNNNYYDTFSRVDKWAEPNQNLPTSMHANLPTYEVRDLRAARELASGVRTIIHSLNSYVNSTETERMERMFR